jgi:hypothetical protein
MLKLEVLTLLYKTTKATILIVAFLFSLRARFTKPRYRTADISEPSGVSTDALIYGSNEQIVTNKINDNELLLLFHKIQYLNLEEVNSIKTMLKAFVFQKDIQKQLS